MDRLIEKDFKSKYKEIILQKPKIYSGSMKKRDASLQSIILQKMERLCF